MIKLVEEFSNVSLRRTVDAGTDEQRKAVLGIIDEVRQGGDQAILRLTAKFDRVELDRFTISENEIKDAYEEIDDTTVEAFKEAMYNIRQFHEQQKRNSWMTTASSGTILGQRITPLDRVGVYVPGGTAALLSSVLMTVIPAQVAGVEEIVMMTPPSHTGNIAAGVLVAADLLGVKEIYKIGGAQAIAALAYGTESVQCVDKIVGPGNIYVALAKREVFGRVDIDMVAGPSEIVVLADGNQNPRYIAADLLSQAEHDVLASAVCVTTSKELAIRIQEEVEKQLKILPREEIARSSIENYGAIYVTETLEEAIDVVNQLAPEHLELLVQDPFHWLGQIKHAGAIFLGEYSSEPVGDYFAGPNHVLPTNGTARFSSPLNVDDFLKKSSIISYHKNDFLLNAEKIMRLARYEGLEGHARAIGVRLEEEGEKS
jgi:histidinol dehydrogenase